jgi:hypothetical protein
LEDPANLGAPMPSTLSPRASRFFERGRRSFGRESGRMVLFSLLGGAGVIVFLLVLGKAING